MSASAGTHLSSSVYLTISTLNTSNEEAAGGSASLREEVDRKLKKLKTH